MRLPILISIWGGGGRHTTRDTHSRSKYKGGVPGAGLGGWTTHCNGSDFGLEPRLGSESDSCPSTPSPIHLPSAASASHPAPSALHPLTIRSNLAWAGFPPRHNTHPLPSQSAAPLLLLHGPARAAFPCAMLCDPAGTRA